MLLQYMLLFIDLLEMWEFFLSFLNDKEEIMQRHLVLLSSYGGGYFKLYFLSLSM